MNLCLNCLEPHTARLTEVGPSKGSQRDPYRHTLSLCPACSGPLIDGDLSTFHRRYRDSREVTR